MNQAAGPPSSVHRVVVLGAGFAGLRVAKALRKAPVDVTVIDRQNHHLFQPLLYQVATAGLAGPDIAAPIRRILRRHRNVTVLYADITGVDPERQSVHAGGSELAYDTLVVATGATHSYFGNDDWAEHAPGLKTLADAQRIRSQVLRAYEAAERSDGAVPREDLLRFVVVGGGPTGVELAGALAELARKILPRDFRHIDAGRAEVLLLEGGDRVLSAYSKELSASAQRQLEGLGVTVRCGAQVSGIDRDGVDLKTGERIASQTVLWAAGVRAASFLDDLGAPLDRAGRVMVEENLTVPGRPSIYVLGDAAHVRVAGGESAVPGVAPAAMQMGAYAARGIQARALGRSPSAKPFAYRDKGSMATIGRASAIADLGRFELRGFFAWIAWLFIHLMFLVGFRSKLVVLVNWAWAYVGYRPAARVLSELAGGPDREPNRETSRGEESLEDVQAGAES